jgi:LacI family transcriptional regulator
MQDVADLAKVSVQTVSCVTNRKPGITEETQARVMAAIDALGYRPDLTARGLRTGQTMTIALMLSDVSSPVASRMAIAAESRAFAENYNLVLYNTCDDIRREQFYIDSILQRSVDGVLYVAARDESTTPAVLREAGIPVVAIDRVPAGHSGPCVVLDNVNAGRLAATHLLELGHTKIAHIGGPVYVQISKERLTGFRAALELSNRQVELTVEPAADWRIESGYIAAQRLLARQDGFTALFAAGDLLAIGAMRALREAGLRVPEDVSLIGLDDIDLGAYLSPPLTTISQSIARIAEAGMGLVLSIIQGKEVDQGTVVIEPYLVERSSTAAI